MKLNSSDARSRTRADIRLAIFDLAGTTVHDEGQVTGAFVSALGAHGIDVTPQQLVAIRGSSKREAVRQFVPPGPDAGPRADAIYAAFRARLTDAYRTGGVRPVAGAERVMRALRERDVRVALNTGFDRDMTRLLIEALGWQRIADAVVCGDDVRQGRPAPYLIFHAMEATGVTSVHGVANVGDTTLDLAAGHNAGVRWNVGVLTGAHPREMLAAAPHTHILPSVADLLSIL